MAVAVWSMFQLCWGYAESRWNTLILDDFSVKKSFLGPLCMKLERGCMRKFMSDHIKGENGMNASLIANARVLFAAQISIAMGQ